MIRKDPAARLPGAEPQPQPEIDPRDEDLLNQVTCDNPDIMTRIKQGLRGQADRHGREIEGGFTITAAAGKFMNEHEEAKLVGVEVTKLAREQVPQSAGFVWVKFNPQKHGAGCSKKVFVRQFFHLPGGGDGFPKVYVVEHEECHCIGFKLSLNLLERMEAAGTLSAHGRALLIAQGGEPVEELIEEVTIAE